VIDISDIVKSGSPADNVAHDLLNYVMIIIDQVSCKVHLTAPTPGDSFTDQVAETLCDYWGQLAGISLVVHFVDWSKEGAIELMMNVRGRGVLNTNRSESSIFDSIRVNFGLPTCTTRSTVMVEAVRLVRRRIQQLLLDLSNCDWRDFLDDVQYSCNASVWEILGKTPIEEHSGRPPRVIWNDQQKFSSEFSFAEVSGTHFGQIPVDDYSAEEWKDVDFNLIDFDPPDDDEQLAEGLGQPRNLNP